MFTFNYVAGSRGSTKHINASNGHFGRNVQVNAVYFNVNVYNRNDEGEWVKTRSERRTFVTVR